VCRATDAKGAKFKLGIKLFGFQIKDNTSTGFKLRYGLENEGGVPVDWNDWKQVNVSKNLMSLGQLATAFLSPEYDGGFEDISGHEIMKELKSEHFDLNFFAQLASRATREGEVANCIE